MKNLKNGLIGLTIVLQYNKVFGMIDEFLIGLLVGTITATIFWIIMCMHITKDWSEFTEKMLRKNQVAE